MISREEAKIQMCYIVYSLIDPSGKINEIYDGVDELKAELKAKDEENTKLKERIAELEAKLKIFKKLAGRTN